MSKVAKTSKAGATAASTAPTPPIPIPAPCIRIRGARTHNLQNLDLDRRAAS